MRFLVIMLARVLLFLSAIVLIRGLLRSFTRAPSKPRQVAKKLRRDPVCGTYVAEDISLKIFSGREQLHFCSRRCQEEYLSLQK